MSALPPTPGQPPTPPPTAEPPGPEDGSGGQPLTGRAQVSPVLTGALGVAVGAGLALAIALPLALDGVITVVAD